MKYPIGIQTFDKIRTDGYAYVDKTDMVYSLATQGTIYFLSRPRRFGKSLLVSTLESYFSGRRDLFKGLKIDTLEKEWNVYPVFHLDFNGPDYSDAGAIKKKILKFITDYEAIYGGDDRDLTLSDRFAELLKKAHERTGRRCVVLVDEYDKPLLDVMATGLTVDVEGNRMTLEDFNRETLKAFYSTFKLADAHLQFVLLTGVTKFSQLSVFSGFNQPQDISMHPRYETLCGMTDEEIEETFHGSIEEMAEENGCSYDEMRVTLRRNYDGYHFSKRMRGVYNPYSLLSALNAKDIQDYWFATGTPTYLMRLLAKSHEDLDEMTGKFYTKAQFEDYRADSQQPLPMIYQSGYLTIKGYDRDMNTFRLDFPNDEVKNGFATMLANSYLGQKEDAGSLVRDLVAALKRCDLDRFHDLLRSFLADIPYNVRRKENERERERYFTYTLYLLFRIASCYTTYAEKAQSRGRLDCVVETGGAVFVFEFKLDGSAAEAMAQIDDRGYATPYMAQGRRVFKVGASISSETGTIEDWLAVEAREQAPKKRKGQ